MTHALVVNTGSSSIKLALCDTSGRRLWQVQRSWGLPQADAGGQPLVELLEQWLSPLLAALEPLPQLVIHRIVHGGAHFSAPTLLSPQVLAELANLVPLAPLHNGPAWRPSTGCRASWRAAPSNSGPASTPPSTPVSAKPPPPTPSRQPGASRACAALASTASITSTWAKRSRPEIQTSAA